MLYCDKCKLSIRTDHKCCPLCHGGIRGIANEDDAIFPDLPAIKRHHVSFFSMLTFCCVLAVIFSFIVNNLVTSNNKWFLYVIGGVCLVWIVLVWGKSKSRNLLKNAIWQTIIIGAGIGICDVFIGWKGWSLDWALPILIGITTVFNIFITLLKKLPPSEYLIYLLLNGIFGMLPLLLVQLHVVKFTIPSIACSGLAMVLLAALIIFKWNQLIHELEKKFHM